MTPMAYFDFEGEAVLQIETKQKLRSAVIRPLRENIPFTIDENVLKFKIKRRGPISWNWTARCTARL